MGKRIMNGVIIQLTSVLDPEENIQKIQKLIDDLPESKQIDAIFLPECFYSMSNGEEPTPYLVEFENSHYLAIKKMAQKYECYLLGGSVAFKNELGQIVNRVLNIGPSGDLINFYDKQHLFSVKIDDADKSLQLNESKIYTAGNKTLCFNYNEFFKIGCAICFDVRFPEEFRSYFHQGVNVFTIPAAFTVPTGKAHWEILLRAKAIENQSYVIASAQWGQHNKKIQTYGHSMVIDPWGEVIFDLGEGEKAQTFLLEFDQICKVRKRMDITNENSFNCKK